MADVSVLDRIRKKINDSEFHRRRQRGEDLGSTPKTIFPIPSLLRQADPRLYEPTLFSIGPYHRDEPELEKFDNKKTLSTWPILVPGHPTTNIKLAHCVEAVMKLELEARSCYEDTETFRLPSSRDELVMLLVMDGCFIIALFYRFFSLGSELELWAAESPLMVCTDLLKLENQIPFFVLEVLFELLVFPSIIEEEWLQFLSEWGSNGALRLFAVNYLREVRPEFPISISVAYLRSIPKVHHLLHLYYLCITPHPQEEDEESNWISRYNLVLADSLMLFPDILMAMIFSPHRVLRCIFMKALAFLSRRPPSPSLPELLPSIIIPCATQLQEDGVEFVKKRKCTSLCDVTFSRRRAIMRIPQLSIHSDTVALFANLIHYEQRRCKDQKKYGRLEESEWQKKYMTSYVFLMVCLVKSRRDAAALRESEIIVSEQDDKEVAEFFNKIRGFCDVTGADYCYAHLSDEVKKYRKFKLLRWRAYFALLKLLRWRAYFAQLKRDYFGRPWVLISFLAALILLCLTIVQTFFTVYPYYHPR